MLIDASPIDRAASRDRAGAAMNRSPESDPCTIASTSRHVGDPPSIIDADRLGHERRERRNGRRVHPRGERATRWIELQHDRPRPPPTTPRRARPQSSSWRHRRARRWPRSGLSPRPPQSAASAVASTIGSASTTRTSSAAATIGAEAAATSTDSDCRPSALVGAIGNATTTPSITVGSVVAAPIRRSRTRRDHELHRDPLAQSDGQCTFVDLDGDHGVARSDERTGLHGLRRHQRAGHEADLGVRARPANRADRQAPG